MQKMEVKKILNDVVWFKALALVLVITLCVTSFGVIARADTELTQDIPDFEAYAKTNGYSLDNYDYYLIGVYDRDGVLTYNCFWFDNPEPLIKNPDTSGGDWSTAVYFAYMGLSNALFAKIQVGSDGIVKSSYVAPNSQFMYLGNDFEILFSNYDIKMQNTDGTFETFFYQAPLKRGQKVTIGTNLSSQTIQQPIMRQIVSLIPLVIGLAVLAIGLRKALRMLLARLRRV